MYLRPFFRRNHMKCISIIVSLFCFLSAYAQQDSVVPFDKAYKRVYYATKISDNKPVIDGMLNDLLWQEEGVWTEKFVQVSPFERVISLSPTKAKLFYDDKFIYVGIYCKDAFPEKINQFIGNRDDNSLGDLVSIAFDTYHDFRAAPEFNINAGGNKTDLVVTDKLSVNLSWNAVWEGKTSVNKADSSWSAELKIPFSQLRYNQLSEEGIWGLHIRRIIRRNNEVQNWSMIPLKNNGHVFSFGEVHQMTELPKARGIEFLPYTMGKFTSEPVVPGSPYQTGNRWKGNIGMDAKFALSDFTLDMTINPDYGQVELDPSVMNLTAYETFYDEKRPFFLEGKHILDFASGNDMMFYTRRIGGSPSYSPSGIDNVNSFTETKENVPILGALKLTGTNRHGLTMGVLQSITARSSAKVSRNGMETEEVVEPLTNYSVARVQKNWKGNTLLGGMVTSVNRFMEDSPLKEILFSNAYSAGIDFVQYFSNRLYYIDFKGIYSSVNGSENAISLLQRNPVHYYQRESAQSYLEVDSRRTSLNGTGGYLKVGRKGNAKWFFSETVGWTSPGFDLNAIGYLKEADFYENESEIGYRQTTNWKMFRSNTFTLTQRNRWNYGGESVLNTASLRWQSMTMKRYEVDFKETWAWNMLDSRMLRGGKDMRFDPSFNTYLKINTDKAKRVLFTMTYEGTHNTDGYNSANKISPAFTFRLGNHVYLSSQFDYAWNKDNLQYVSSSVPLGNQILPIRPVVPYYVMGHMSQETYGLTMKLQVNVTPDISLQLYGSPFTSTATFSDFNVADNTTSSTYSERYIPIDPASLKLSNNIYSVEKEGVPVFNFRKPDFSFNEFRSNVVARWEYLPGSTLFFVWEHRMSDRASSVINGWGDNLDRMFGLPARNTFMIKVNYWFSI